MTSPSLLYILNAGYVFFQTIADVIRTCLGPRAMLKVCIFFQNSQNENTNQLGKHVFFHHCIT